MDQHSSHESVWRTYIWIIVFLAIILGKGFFSLAVVSDQGQPTWNYRPMKDVPSQSPYAVYQMMPAPQHVRGAGGQ